MIGSGSQNPSDRGRAASPVVGKALEAAVVVLYLVLLSTVLYGGVVPEYRAAAGTELGDRVLAESVVEIHAAVPQPGARSETDVALPETIRGEPYRIKATDDRLVLAHPHPEIGGERPITVPADVDRVHGEWNSTDRSLIVVTDDGDERVVRLENEVIGA